MVDVERRRVVGFRAVAEQPRVLEPPVGLAVEWATEAAVLLPRERWVEASERLEELQLEASERLAEQD